MGLDIYVGSLTRYLCGDWETIIQKYSREAGIDFRRISPNKPNDAITNPIEILPVVLSWRKALFQNLTKSNKTVLDWDERADAPYFTDKPGWDCYGDLLVWASHSEHPNMKQPLQSINNLENDAAYQLSSNGKTQYISLLGDVEVWFPTDFSFVFTAEWITGDKKNISSSHQLLRELNRINDTSWKFDMRNKPINVDCPEKNKHLLEDGARFAFFLLYNLVNESINNNLVMLLDY